MSTTLPLEDWMNTPPQGDEVFHFRIAPWIDRQRLAMANLDEKRPKGVAYIFHEHIERVADLGYEMALHLGAPCTAAEWYYQALLAHDCGKTLLPAEIWDSGGKPSDAMKIQRRRHAALGGQMIDTDLPPEHPFTAFAADIARHHHEQMDGKGTLGVDAHTLSPWVRLTCIVDSYDGMSVRRPHFGDRDLSPASIYERLSVEKAGQYDPALLAAFKDFLKL